MKAQRDGLKILGMAPACLAMSLLAGCATMGAVEPIPSAVPPTRPLVPAVVYVPTCKFKKSTGLASFHDAGADITRMAVCLGIDSAADIKVAALKGDIPALKNSVSALKGKIAFPTATTVKTSDTHPLGIKPDLQVERAIHARYRIVIQPPRSGMVTHQVGFNPGSPTYQRMQSWITVDFVDIASGKTISHVVFNLKASDRRGATQFFARLVRGIKGPRCQAYPQIGLNVLKLMKRTFKKRPPSCDTFALPAPEPDDDD